MLTLVNIWFQSHDFAKVVRHATPLDRLLAASDMIWFYLGKAVAPIHLSFVYPQWNVTTNDMALGGALAAVVGVSVALILLRNSRWGRPVLIAWTTLLALLPVLGFTDVAYMQWSLVADHYQHLCADRHRALAGAALVRLVQHARSATITLGMINLRWRLLHWH